MPSRQARNSAWSAPESGAKAKHRAESSHLPVTELPHPPLLLVTDRKQAKVPLLSIIEAVLAAGCRWISLREKDLSEPEQTALAAQLLPIARRAGARMTLHGNPHLARACALDGVHLAAGSDPRQARHVLGPGKLVGASIHSLAQARAIKPDVVDYLIAGPVFETRSKPGHGPVLGRSGVMAMAEASAVPLLAIGGVDPARAPNVLGWGCSGFAVMGGVMRAENPRAEMNALLAAFHQPAS
jgi:thiamine-phosphate pyrophosphorylase